MNPESQAIHSLDQRRRMDDIKETAELLLPMHSKIAPLMEKIAIHPDRFEGLYDKEMLASDKRYVVRMKEIFAQEANNKGPNGLTNGEVRNLAEILEYQIINGINVGKWLPLCTATKTSEYDDIKNGVDLVLTYENQESISHLGMGVDITFSHNLDKKFKRIKDEIDNYDADENLLGTVKYFHDRKTGNRSELASVPRVVVALDLGVMKDLSRVKEGGKGHIARHAIVTDMEHQLSVFSDYARENNPLCLDQIMRAQNFMRTMAGLLESEHTLEDSGYSKNIKMQDALERGLSIFR